MVKSNFLPLLYKHASAIMLTYMKKKNEPTSANQPIFIDFLLDQIAPYFK